MGNTNTTNVEEWNGNNALTDREVILVKKTWKAVSEDIEKNGEILFSK